ncbi:MAG: hypothetical protein IH940_13215 [Acidobacteria bacterium]|nr:hypothetical protein [Acidobacteriota bacterium]
MHSLNRLKRYEAKHTKKHGRIPVGYAMIIALVLSGVAVLSTSRAAFTDTTSNTTNYVNAGSVDLTDDDSDGVLFEIDDMVPGDSVTRCIEVTYDGIANPSDVLLYSGGYIDSANNLGDHLDLRVRQGTGGDFTDCTGFASSGMVFNGGALDVFDGNHFSYATGAGNWAPGATPPLSHASLRFASQ